MNKTKDVLIADDNEAIVEALTLMLEDVGYSIRALPTGASYEVMLEIIQQDVPGVLLLDIWMSGKDGRRYLQVSEKSASDAQSSHYSCFGKK